MPKITQAESKDGGMNAFLPKRLYRVRCISTKFGKSSGGHPMTTLSLEIMDESIEVDGKVMDIAGRQASMCLMHVPNETWGQARVYPLCKKLGIDLPSVDDSMGGSTLEYDTDLHKEYFHGMEFDCVLSSAEDVARMEKQPGQKVGDPIKDGEGNIITRGWRINLVSPDDVPDYCNPEKNQEIAAQPY
jgi:hypothetical protein